MFSLLICEKNFHGMAAISIEAIIDIQAGLVSGCMALFMFSSFKKIRMP